MRGLPDLPSEWRTLTVSSCHSGCSWPTIFSALRAGIRGYVLKPQAGEDLVGATSGVLQVEICQPQAATN